MAMISMVAGQHVSGKAWLNGQDIQIHRRPGMWQQQLCLPLVSGERPRTRWFALTASERSSFWYQASPIDVGRTPLKLQTYPHHESIRGGNGSLRGSWPKRSQSCQHTSLTCEKGCQSSEAGLPGHKQSRIDRNRGQGNDENHSPNLS